MRAAAILGLGSSPRDLKPFQKISDASWLVGLPAAPNEAEVIFIFGGDGTVHRHLAQLVKLQLPVLVVPAGSGNDFARALNLHSVRDSLSAWKKFASSAANVRTIDLGVIIPLASRVAIAEEAEPARRPCQARAATSAVWPDVDWMPRSRAGQTNFRDGCVPMVDTR